MKHQCLTCTKYVSEIVNFETWHIFLYMLKMVLFLSHRWCKENSNIVTISYLVTVNFKLYFCKKTIVLLTCLKLLSSVFGFHSFLSDTVFG